MIGHMPKQVPDRVLKGLILGCILTAIEEENRPLSSLEIHNFISKNSMEFISPELDSRGNPVFYGDYSYNNLPGVRSGLSYLKKAGYVSLYDRDKYGNILRIKQTKPYVWYLTPEGEIHARDTFHKYRIRLDANDKIVAHLLSNDEAVTELAESKSLLLCKTCKLNHPKAQRLPARTWTVKPHKGKIGAQLKDGTIVEIEVTDEGVIKELEDLKSVLVRRADGSIDNESTILSLQNRCTAYEKIMKNAGIEIGRLDTQLTKVKERKGKLDEKAFIRNMDRMSVAHYYYEGGYWLDAEFFNVWKGSLAVVEYERLLKLDMQIFTVDYDIQSTKGEIMKRTGFTKRILEPEEIPGIGIYITEIRAGSIVVNSEHFQAPKTLTV